MVAAFGNPSTKKMNRWVLYYVFLKCYESNEICCQIYKKKKKKKKKSTFVCPMVKLSMPASFIGRDGHQNLKLLLIDLNQMHLIGLVERNILVIKCVNVASHHPNWQNLGRRGVGQFVSYEVSGHL